MPYIRTIPPGEAEGELSREYEVAQRRAGVVAHILQLQSLNPAVLRPSPRFSRNVRRNPATRRGFSRNLG